MSKIDPTVEMYILEMERDKLYGELVIKYDNGRAVLLKKTETVKPANDRSTRSDDGSDD